MNQNTRKMVIAAIMTAIIILLVLTPLGYITLPMVAITIVTIPACIGAMMLGPWYAIYFGVVFGLTSWFRAMTTGAGILTPLFVNPLISVLPRIFVPLAAWGAYRLMNKILRTNKGNIGKTSVSGVVAGVIGAAVNTVLVAAAFYFFGYDQFVGLYPLDQGGFIVTIAALFLPNGIPEAIASGVICGAVMLALTKFEKGRTA